MSPVGGGSSSSGPAGSPVAIAHGSGGKRALPERSDAGDRTQDDNSDKVWGELKERLQAKSRRADEPIGHKRKETE